MSVLKGINQNNQGNPLEGFLPPPSGVVPDVIPSAKLPEKSKLSENDRRTLLAERERQRQEQIGFLGRLKERTWDAAKTLTCNCGELLALTGLSIKTLGLGLVSKDVRDYQIKEIEKIQKFFDEVSPSGSILSNKENSPLSEKSLGANLWNSAKLGFGLVTYPTTLLINTSLGILSTVFEEIDRSKKGLGYAQYLKTIEENPSNLRDGLNLLTFVSLSIVTAGRVKVPTPMFIRSMRVLQVMAPSLGMGTAGALGEQLMRVENANEGGFNTRKLVSDAISGAMSSSIFMFGMKGVKNIAYREFADMSDGTSDLFDTFAETGRVEIQNDQISTKAKAARLLGFGLKLGTAAYDLNDAAILSKKIEVHNNNSEELKVSDDEVVILPAATSKSFATIIYREHTLEARQAAMRLQPIGPYEDSFSRRSRRRNRFDNPSPLHGVSHAMNGEMSRLPGNGSISKAEATTGNQANLGNIYQDDLATLNIPARKELASALNSALEELKYEEFMWHIWKSNQELMTIEGAGAVEMFFDGLVTESQDNIFVTRQINATRFLSLGKSLSEEEFQEVFAENSDNLKKLGVESGLIILEEGKYKLNYLKLCSLKPMNANNIFFFADNRISNGPAVRVYIGTDSWDLNYFLWGLEKINGIVVEPCSGTAIQVMTLAALNPQSAEEGITKAIGIEIDQRAINVSSFNILLNGFEDRIEIVDSFERAIERLGAEKISVVVSNPPFILAPEWVEIPDDEISMLPSGAEIKMDDEGKLFVNCKTLFPKAGWGGEDGLAITKEIIDRLYPYLSESGRFIIYSEFAGTRLEPTLVLNLIKAEVEKRDISFSWTTFFQDKDPLSYHIYLFNLFLSKHPQFENTGFYTNIFNRAIELLNEQNVSIFHSGVICLGRKGLNLSNPSTTVGDNLSASLESIIFRFSTFRRFRESPEQFSFSETAKLARNIQKPKVEIIYNQRVVTPSEYRDLYDKLDPKQQMMLVEAEGILEQLEEYQKKRPRVFAIHHQDFTVSEKITLLRGLEYLNEIYPHLDPFAYLSEAELADLRAADSSAVLEDDMPDEVRVIEDHDQAIALMEREREVQGVLIPCVNFRAQFRAIEMAILKAVSLNSNGLGANSEKINVYEFQINQESDLRTILDDLADRAQNFLPVTVNKTAVQSWKEELLKRWKLTCDYANHNRGKFYFRIFPEVRIHLTPFSGPHRHEWAAATIWNSGDGGTCLFSEEEFYQHWRKTILDDPEHLDWLRYNVPSSTALLSGKGKRGISGGRRKGDEKEFVFHETNPNSSFRARILFRFVIETAAGDIERCKQRLNNNLTNLEKLYAVEKLLVEGIYLPKMVSIVLEGILKPAGETVIDESLQRYDISQRRYFAEKLSRLIFRHFDVNFDDQTSGNIDLLSRKLREACQANPEIISLLDIIIEQSELNTEVIRCLSVLNIVFDLVARTANLLTANQINIDPDQERTRAVALALTTLADELKVHAIKLAEIDDFTRAEIYQEILRNLAKMIRGDYLKGEPSFVKVTAANFFIEYKIHLENLLLLLEKAKKEKFSRRLRERLLIPEPVLQEQGAVLEWERASTATANLRESTNLLDKTKNTADPANLNDLETIASVEGNLELFSRFLPYRSVSLQIDGNTSVSIEDFLYYLFTNSLITEDPNQFYLEQEVRVVRTRGREINKFDITYELNVANAGWQAIPLNPKMRIVGIVNPNGARKLRYRVSPWGTTEVFVVQGETLPTIRVQLNREVPKHPQYSLFYQILETHFPNILNNPYEPVSVRSSKSIMDTVVEIREFASYFLHGMCSELRELQLKAGKNCLLLLSKLKVAACNGLACLTAAKLSSQSVFAANVSGSVIFYNEKESTRGDLFSTWGHAQCLVFTKEGFLVVDSTKYVDHKLRFDPRRLDAPSWARIIQQVEAAGSDSILLSEIAEELRATCVIENENKNEGQGHRFEDDLSASMTFNEEQIKAELLSIRKNLQRISAIEDPKISSIELLKFVKQIFESLKYAIESDKTRLSKMISEDKELNEQITLLADYIFETIESLEPKNDVQQAAILYYLCSSMWVFALNGILLPDYWHKGFADFDKINYIIENPQFQDFAQIFFGELAKKDFAEISLRDLRLMSIYSSSKYQMHITDESEALAADELYRRSSDQEDKDLACLSVELKLRRKVVFSEGSVWRMLDTLQTKVSVISAIRKCSLEFQAAMLKRSYFNDADSFVISDGKIKPRMEVVANWLAMLNYLIESVSISTNVPEVFCVTLHKAAIELFDLLEREDISDKQEKELIELAADNLYQTVSDLGNPYDHNLVATRMFHLLTSAHTVDFKNKLDVLFKIFSTFFNLQTGLLSAEKLCRRALEKYPVISEIANKLEQAYLYIYQIIITSSSNLKKREYLVETGSDVVLTAPEGFFISIFDPRLGEETEEDDVVDMQKPPFGTVVGVAIAYGFEPRNKIGIYPLIKAFARKYPAEFKLLRTAMESILENDSHGMHIFREELSRYWDRFRELRILYPLECLQQGNLVSDPRLCLYGTLMDPFESQLVNIVSKPLHTASQDLIKVFYENFAVRVFNRQIVWLFCELLTSEVLYFEVLNSLSEELSKLNKIDSLQAEYRKLQLRVSSKNLARKSAKGLSFANLQPGGKVKSRRIGSDNLNDRRPFQPGDDPRYFDHITFAKTERELTKSGYELDLSKTRPVFVVDAEWLFEDNTKNENGLDENVAKLLTDLLSAYYAVQTEFKGDKRFLPTLVICSRGSEWLRMEAKGLEEMMIAERKAGEFILQYILRTAIFWEHLDRAERRVNSSGFPEMCFFSRSVEELFARKSGMPAADLRFYVSKKHRGKTQSEVDRLFAKNK